MIKVAIIDLDGPGQVVDNEARAAKAKEAAKGVSSKHYAEVFYGVLFDPELVRLDQLNPGADQAIEALIAQGWIIIYMTSRLEDMRAETERWLRSYRLLDEATNSWLREEHSITQVMLREPFARTTVWKAKKVREIWARLEPEAMLFIDNTEANREAIADLENPRILVKFSLQDALETDQFLHPAHSANASELLMFVESLVNAACVRWRFETEEKFRLRVEHRSPGDDPAWSSMPLEVRAHNKGVQRFVSVTEIMHLKDGREIEALTVAMNYSEGGRAIDVVMGEEIGGQTPIIEPTPEELESEGIVYSHPFKLGDPEQEQQMTEGFATWKAKNLREFLYVEAAKYEREVKLWEMRASREYAKAIEEANARLRKAFLGGDGTTER